MKKLLLIAIFALGITSMYASNGYASVMETEFGRRGGYYRGNMSQEDLPEKAISYLEKYYPGYHIMICKRKGNGYYFVKIGYGGNKYRPYYRSLVFDNSGRIVND